MTLSLLTRPSTIDEYSFPCLDKNPSRLILGVTTVFITDVVPIGDQKYGIFEAIAKPLSSK